ncbi:polymer-forming cytoskeletal protein [Pseudorhodoferax sp. Leaf267]|uniref:polymer-forming cytoskeletal protein n=1 Tax=Pseudorhodoferax sp. Leaf267 TaxID=1736316 RepID=UPI0006FC6C7A|nr:polymer-forming cytoskeletal protein [Pseudorhodoferax sp. Leaf267]KQP13100.1 hypothetical protein ASF43_18475 [Pseudorhodoferax sp. Leaf267]
MTLALLVLLTLCAMAVPMLPAFLEWRRPSDVQPLPIDETDALDPPFLARSFAARLAAAVQAGQTELGRTEIVAGPPAGQPLALTEAERTAGATHRLWHAAGDLRLPDGMAFYAEVAAKGALRAGERSVCKALWAGGALRLGQQSSVLRWAHGDEVFVGQACELAGRVTAERLLVLAPGVGFTLLHAPRLQFLPYVAPGAAVPATTDGAALTGVQWDASGRRAIGQGPLAVPAGTAWQGDLICHGDLTLAPRCAVRGSLKVRGRLTVGAGCVIRGGVFAEDAIVLDEACSVQGVLMSERSIALGAGCTVGTLAVPANVAAPQIDIGAGVVVHGTVWAGEQGRCVAPLPAAVPAGAGAWPSQPGSPPAGAQ